FSPAGIHVRFLPLLSSWLPPHSGLAWRTRKLGRTNAFGVLAHINHLGPSSHILSVDDAAIFRAGPSFDTASSLRHAQQLEGVSPTVLRQAGDAPQHAQWLDRAGGFDGPHVGRVPPELVENPSTFGFRALVISADEHRGRSAGKLRIHHERAAHA